METGGSTPALPVAGVAGAAPLRLVALDFIRGIAVLGILFANITAFAHPSLANTWIGLLPDGGAASDRWLWLVQFVAVDGKFRGLFSILFGAGIVLFTERCVERGEDGRRQLLRLFWLALFGLAHMMLLWTGDILFLYALAGMVALVALGWTPRVQLLAGLVWYLAGSLVLASNSALPAMLELDEARRMAMPESWALYDGALQARLAEARELTAIVTTGSYAEYVAFNWGTLGKEIGNSVTIALLETIPLMILGMALFRMGLFGTPDGTAALPRKRILLWGWAGVIAGGAVFLALGLFVMLHGFSFWLTQFIAYGLSAFPRLAMIAGLTCLLALAAPRASAPWLGEKLVAAGRMAFTNYIATSALMLLLFHGWAGGLYGQLGRLPLLAVVALAWGLMLWWSQPWLARFRHGPLEWLWRCLTYGRIFPFRR